MASQIKQKYIKKNELKKILLLPHVTSTGKIEYEIKKNLALNIVRYRIELNAMHSITVPVTELTFQTVNKKLHLHSYGYAYFCTYNPATLFPNHYN